MHLPPFPAIYIVRSNLQTTPLERWFFLLSSTAHMQVKLEEYDEAIRKMKVKLGRQRGSHTSVAILSTDQPRGSSSYKKQVKNQAKQFVPLVQQFEREGCQHLLVDALHKLLQMFPDLKEVRSQASSWFECSSWAFVLTPHITFYLARALAAIGSPQWLH